MDDDYYGADSELIRDGYSDRSSGFADKRSEMDVAAVAVRRRRESVADAVEMGVSSGRILEESADTLETVRLDGAGERSSHLVEQKTWE